MTNFATIPPLTHQSDGHRHAWEALDGLARGVMDVCNVYSRPFVLTHNQIMPNQADVRRATLLLAEGFALLQNSLRVPS